MSIAAWGPLVFAVALEAQLPDAASVSFAYERPGLPVPSFEIRVMRDGTGMYRGVGMIGPMRDGAAPQPFSQQISVSQAAVDKVFSVAREMKWFTANCNAKAKNLANTGRKTLGYTGPDGAGSCVYNYSDVKGVTDLTTLFLGMAETMDEGRELDRLHRYDRLGLDAAMQLLGEEIAAGRAVEIQNIAPSLRSIVADTELIQRVRTRAVALLATLPPEAAQTGR